MSWSNSNAAVQFQGCESIIAAFNNRDVKAWTVFQGKTLITKGWGADQLRNFLQALGEGSTNTIYYLKVYEDIESEKDVKKIKTQTQDDGAFAFRLNEDTQSITPSQYNNWKSGRELFTEMQALRAEIEQLKADDNDDYEEEKPKSALGFIGDLASDPDKLKSFIGSIQLIKSLLFPANNQGALPMPGTIGNIPGSQPQPGGDKLNQVVNELQQYDNRLTDHLEKLLNMAKTNNASFVFLLQTLDTMQL